MPIAPSCTTNRPTKMIDQIYHCQLPGQVFGVWQLQCRLQIFQPDTNVQTVVISDMGFEMGWFIPYVVEKLIDQIVAAFSLDPAKLVWIEHYTPGFKKPTCADFSQVTFDWCDGQAINPQWVAISPEVAETLMSVEATLQY